MRLRFVILSVAAIAPGLSSPAIARDQKPYRPSPPTITASPLAMAVTGFDRDANLQVSRPEYDWGVSKSFAAFDRDSDEVLSLIELTSWSEQTLGNQGALPGRFDFDRDGDDRVSRVEFVTSFAAKFAELDKNKDALLSRAELVSVVDPPFDMPKRRRSRIEAPRSR